jgi:hypothetical protein
MKVCRSIDVGVWGCGCWGCLQVYAKCMLLEWCRVVKCVLSVVYVLVVGR